MSQIANTPKPPYYAVIFTSHRTPREDDHNVAAARMVELAAGQEGFLGVESAREGVGITVSYWSSLKAIKQWKSNAEHLEAQRKGRSNWYSSFKVRVSRVEREYGM